MKTELIMEYMDRLVRETFGPDDYSRIMHALANVENGYCGCEMYYFTFPRLLASRGVLPTRSYVTEYGQPPEDGQAAATRDQRDLISNALRQAGFSV